MALAACLECGKEVSSEAQACQLCGEPSNCPSATEPNAEGGRPMQVWREVGVAAVADYPPSALFAGVYLPVSDSEVRWLQRDPTQTPSDDELDATPAGAVAELWARAQGGWPER